MIPSSRFFAGLEAIVIFILVGYILFQLGRPPVPINTLVVIIAIGVGLAGGIRAVFESPTLPLPPPKNDVTR